jgi:hypothetical protein
MELHRWRALALGWFIKAVSLWVRLFQKRTVA